MTIDLDTCMTWPCNDYVEHHGEMVRGRYVVADAIDDYARELSKDRSGLLRYISGQIRYGAIPSKKSTRKAAKELAVIRARLESGAD